MPPLASILTAVDDHPPDLDRWLGALADQTLSRDAYEVVIVDPLGLDAYGEALERLRARAPDAPVRYERTDGGGRARCLNRALELASGAIAIFLASDLIVPPGYVEAHVRFHREHPERGAIGVGAAIIGEADRNPFNAWLESSGALFGAAMLPGMDAIAPDFFYVGNASVKRAFLDRAGRFDERFRHHAGEDWELGRRLVAAGGQSRLVPEAEVVHEHPITLRERVATMHQAGEALVLQRELAAPGEFDGHSALLPLRRHVARTARASVRARLRRDAHAREAYWRARLELALAVGYRRGRWLRLRSPRPA